MKRSLPFVKRSFSSIISFSSFGSIEFESFEKNFARSGSNELVNLIRFWTLALNSSTSFRTREKIRKRNFEEISPRFEDDWATDEELWDGTGATVDGTHLCSTSVESPTTYSLDIVSWIPATLRTDRNCRNTQERPCSRHSHRRILRRLQTPCQIQIRWKDVRFLECAWPARPT